MEDSSLNCVNARHKTVGWPKFANTQLWSQRWQDYTWFWQDEARSKRVFDLVVGSCLAVLMAPIIAGLALLVLAVQGRPIFHCSERMRTLDQGFMMWKIRTMTADPRDANISVSGGDKAARITPLGAILRRWRLDEFPQIWNVLRGDMSLVGPRPQVRFFVDRHRKTYAKLLRNPPGLTGLGSLIFHRHEQTLLERCRTAKSTQETYERRCLPRKARLDLLYTKNGSRWLDIVILARTGALFLPRIRWGGRGVKSL